MAVAFVQARINSVNTGSPTVTLSSAPTAGNVVIIYIGISAASIPATPAGFSVAGSSSGGTGTTARGALMAYRVVQAGDSATIASTTSGVIWNMSAVEYSGLNTTTPFQAGVVATGGLASSTTLTTPAITPTASSSVLIVCGLNVRSTASATDWTSCTIGGNAANIRGNNALNNQAATGYGVTFDLPVTSASGTYAGSGTNPSASNGNYAIAAFNISTLPILVTARHI